MRSPWRNVVWGHRLVSYETCRGARSRSAGTVRRDDPRLTVRLPGVDAARRRVVLAPRLDLSPHAKVFGMKSASAPRTLVFAGDDCAEAEVARFRDVAEVVRVPESAAGLDLAAVLSHLTRAGIESVLVEGGGKTSGAFLRDGLVDEIVLFIASSLLGADSATPVVDLPAATDPGKAWRVACSAVIPIGADLIVVGRPEAR